MILPLCASPVSLPLCPCLPVCVGFLCLSLFVCIRHSASVVWWLRLWFLSSQHSSKYSDKTRRTPRSLRPGQSIREKTTQRSGCFCSIKQPSEQQQPFSVWDVELILPRFLFLYFFRHPSLSITVSKKEKRKPATTPTVRAVNTICDGASFFLYHLPSGPSEQPAELSSRKKNKNKTWWWMRGSECETTPKPEQDLGSWTCVMQLKVSSRVFSLLIGYRIRDNAV